MSMIFRSWLVPHGEQKKRQDELCPESWHVAADVEGDLLLGCRRPGYDAAHGGGRSTTRGMRMPHLPGDAKRSTRPAA